MKYVIYLPKQNEFVSGFNRQHLIVQKTALEPKARHFRTMQQALDYIERYADAGYALSREDCRIDLTD